MRAQPEGLDWIYLPECVVILDTACLQKLYIRLYFRTIGPSGVCALADVVGTKLIILFPSFHLLISQKGFSYNFEFLHAFLSNQKNKI